MRLPFLQVTQDAWRLSRMLVPLLHKPRQHALGLILDLWVFGLDLGPADEPPHGLLMGARWLDILAGALEWSGPPVELANALEHVGLIERTEDGIRIKGLDRYHAAFKKAQIDRERKASARRAKDGAAPSDGRRRESPGKTYTYTYKKKKKHGAAVAPPRADESPTVSEAQKPDAPTEPPKPPAQSSEFRVLQSELVETFADYVGGKYAWNGAKDSEALKRLMGVARADLIIARWRAGLRASGWQQVSTVAQLWQKWNDLGRTVPAPPEPAPEAELPPQPDTAAGRKWAEAYSQLRERTPYAAKQMTAFRGVELRDGRLILEAPDEYAQAWCQLHFADVLPAVAGCPVDIVAPPRPAAQEASL